MSYTHFHTDTHQEVQQVLEQLRLNKKRVRIFYGDPKNPINGHCEPWDEEHDVLGTICRSTGPQQVPILLPRTNSTGGPAILDNHIIRIISSKYKGLWEYYRHPLYQTPTYVLLNFSKHSVTSPWRVWRRDKEIAGFQSQDKALAWIDFMMGNRCRR